METEVVYNGRDNTIDLLFKADGVVVDLDSVTKIKLVFRPTTGNSTEIEDEEPTQWPIKWATSETGMTGKMLLRLGDQGLDEGLYLVDFIVYDSGNDAGIDWSGISGVEIYVKGDAVTEASP